MHRVIERGDEARCVGHDVVATGIHVDACLDEFDDVGAVFRAREAQAVALDLLVELRPDGAAEIGRRSLTLDEHRRLVGQPGRGGRRGRG